MLQQLRAVTRSDFHFLDAAGAPIATVTGGNHSFFMGTRELYVSDVTGPVFHLTDPVDFMLDTFEFFAPNGQPLGRVKQRMAVMNQAFDVEVFDGSRLHLERRAFSHDITFTLGQFVVGRAAQQWAGFTSFMLGRDQYGLQYDPGAPPHHRIAMLAALLALDLHDAKQQNST